MINMPVVDYVYMLMVNPNGNIECFSISPKASYFIIDLKSRVILLDT